MTNLQMSAVLQHLRRAAARKHEDETPDAQLLERFVCLREEAAFAALLRRHGPMVLGVYRGILRQSHDVEDAFQATFLVLVQKAASIRRRGSVECGFIPSASRQREQGGSPLQTSAGGRPDNGQENSGRNRYYPSFYS